MQREEKILDAVLDNLILRVADLKNSIHTFLLKLEHEHETLTWPTVLDNFLLFSGQMNTLLKIMKNEKTPILRNMITLPLHITQDRDEELVKLTDGRISIFSHEVVPDYLRTKADPDVEAREQQLIQKCNQAPVDASHKLVTATNKISNTILEHIRVAREDWESESGARASAAQTSSISDTNLLISAVCLGKGLKSQGKMAPGMQQPQGPPSQSQQLPTQMSGIGKAPSAIKTNIKSGGSIHPYNRN
uniref:Mediator of RNA polymerase II transcription subunit 8 n=1 Tax=Strigamia maritima TaxID=126957 RepID=T1IR38_STRMM